MKFADEKERELYAAATLGEDARNFLASSVGKYLHGRAVNDLEQAKEDLLKVDPDSFWGRRKFRKIQQRAEIAQKFIGYLVDAIQDGDMAYQELQDRENKN